MNRRAFVSINDFGLPGKQKIAVNKFWESGIGEEKKVELERNANNSGREFWAWIFWVAWKPGKARPKNSLSKFAEKFAGNFPKVRRAKIKNSPQIRSAYRRDQMIWGVARVGRVEIICPDILNWPGNAWKNSWPIFERRRSQKI